MEADKDNTIRPMEIQFETDEEYSEFIDWLHCPRSEDKLFKQMREDLKEIRKIRKRSNSESNQSYKSYKKISPELSKRLMESAIRPEARDGKTLLDRDNELHRYIMEDDER